MQVTDEQDQRDHHARVFDPGNARIVTADGVDVGTLSVDHGPAPVSDALREPGL